MGTEKREMGDGRWESRDSLVSSRLISGTIAAGVIGVAQRAVASIIYLWVSLFYPISLFYPRLQSTNSAAVIGDRPNLFSTRAARPLIDLRIFTGSMHRHGWHAGRGPQHQDGSLKVCNTVPSTSSRLSTPSSIRTPQGRSITTRSRRGADRIVIGMSLDDVLLLRIRQ